MSITPEEIANTAHLARLKIDDQHVPEVTERITAILELIDQMQAVDTTDVAPMAHPLDAVLRLRADEITEDSATAIEQRTAFQAIAPAVEDGLFLVPKVIE